LGASLERGTRGIIGSLAALAAASGIGSPSISERAAQRLRCKAGQGSLRRSDNAARAAICVGKRGRAGRGGGSGICASV